MYYYYLTYKLFIGILKTKIEHHFRYIKEESEVQTGVTKNIRISDNLIVLGLCLLCEAIIQKKKPSVLNFNRLSIDSIKKDTLK